jgi:hypothetical protein
MTVDTFKTCKDCDREVALGGFSPSKNHKDGLLPVCKSCRNLKLRAAYSANPEKFLTRARRWSSEPKNKPAQRVSRQRRYAATKPLVAESAAVWRNANLEKRRAYNAARRAAKANATPSWLTAEEKQAIAQVFVRARTLEKRCGEPMHVDHILPLKSDWVCGLHVPWNLRVLPAAKNIAKGNKHV